jgi:hypothetical protein
MKKSNILLLIVLASVFILLGFTRTTLLNKFRNNQVKLTTWAEIDESGLIDTYTARHFTDGFRHIVFTGGNGYIDWLTVRDSAITDREGQPIGFIKYHVEDSVNVNPDIQFRVRRDTMYIDVSNLAAATIYSNGLRYVSSMISRGSYPIYIESVKADTILLHAGSGGRIRLKDCSLKFLNATADFGSFVICEESTKIDTLGFSVGPYAEFTLNNFTGFVKHAFVDWNGKLVLEGRSVKSFADVKWNK